MWHVGQIPILAHVLLRSKGNGCHLLSVCFSMVQKAPYVPIYTNQDNPKLDTQFDVIFQSEIEPRFCGSSQYQSNYETFEKPWYSGTCGKRPWWMGFHIMYSIFHEIVHGTLWKMMNIEYFHKLPCFDWWWIMFQIPINLLILVMTTNKYDFKSFGLLRCINHIFWVGVWILCKLTPGAACVAGDRVGWPMGIWTPQLWPF